MNVKLGVTAGTYPNGETIGDVLAYNHYGTETIPPRPVLRIAAENTMKTLSSDAGMEKSILETFMHNMMKNPRDAKALEIEFLQKLGSQSAAEAKRIIGRGSELQHNAPATVKKKRSDKPLYETGLLQKHISYEVSE